MPILSRRLLLAAPGLTLAPRARADAPFTGADLLLVLLSDLHSAGDRAAAALGVLDAALAANRGVPVIILVNGDVFERGNAIALRSAGAADWAFLGALRRRAPVVLNVGNHETALNDDLAETIRRALALDLIVLTNIRDRRTGQPFASHTAELPLPNGRRLRLVGIGTDMIQTYRQVVRPTLDIPAPAAWARDNLPGLLAGADMAVVLNHGGVLADREIFPTLPDGTLMLGGHDHLRFTEAAGNTRLVHTGSWNRFVTVAGVTLGGAPRIALREVEVQPGTAEDATQAALWREVQAAHGLPVDREVLFSLPRPLSLAEGARQACAAIAAAAGAVSGLVGHTTFGTGLPAGEVTRLAFDAFIRFDGPVMRGEADAAALAAMAPRLDQDRDMPLAARIGDFAYAMPPPASPGVLATADWVAMNARDFLGTEAIRFERAGDLRLKTVTAAALGAMR